MLWRLTAKCYLFLLSPSYLIIVGNYLCLKPLKDQMQSFCCCEKVNVATFRVVVDATVSVAGPGIVNFLFSCSCCFVCVNITITLPIHHCYYYLLLILILLILCFSERTHSGRRDTDTVLCRCF